MALGEPLDKRKVAIACLIISLIIPTLFMIGGIADQENIRREPGYTDPGLYVFVFLVIPLLMDSFAILSIYGLIIKAEWGKNITVISGVLSLVFFIFVYPIVLLWALLSKEKKHPQRLYQQQMDQNRFRMIQQARNYETARNFENAALIYEQLYMWKEAGRVRRLAEGNIRTTGINYFIQQLREQGLTITYNCPNCRGAINIHGNTREASLRYCNSCGSPLDNHDIIDFLKNVI